jgi:hypothetical protein
VVCHVIAGVPADIQRLEVRVLSCLFFSAPHALFSALHAHPTRSQRLLGPNPDAAHVKLVAEKFVVDEFLEANKIRTNQVAQHPELAPLFDLFKSVNEELPLQIFEEMKINRPSPDKVTSALSLVVGIVTFSHRSCAS